MDGILYERRGAVAVITFDRPAKLNALDLAAMSQFERLWRTAAEDEDVAVLVLTGSGDRAFCAGADLGELIPRLTAGTHHVVGDPTKRFLGDCFKPVIAAVNGICTAAGLEILLGTDLRIASERATFALGEVRWGMVPGAGSHVRLPRQVPWAIAMQLLLTGDPIDARRAYEVGLVNEVVPHGEVLDRALALAERLTANAPLAMRTAKEIAVRALGLEPGFVLEHALNDRVLRSEDAVEGPRAFVEKRRPRYRGR